MKIAVEGCAHGELDNIYESIKLLEENEGIKVDLLICCGDFQTSRNEEDLFCMAIPQKYFKLCTFYKYYNGEKVAPVLTIFIGGNHEASNYLQELPYGGWVAPNIYYLGYAGVINIAGIRIAGLSGIYKGHDYMKGHFEKPPYDEVSKRSVYHIRNIEVFRLKQLSQPVDIFLSHDWPTGITEHGNSKQLMKFKPFLKEDIQSGKLGSPPCEDLLNHLKPSYWFSAHLHCKFAALVPHGDGKITKFLALDKCLPNRRFLQIVEIPHDSSSKIKISYDLEWLTILHFTNHLLGFKNTTHYMPGPKGNERWCFTPSKEETELILCRFEQNLTVPQNFVQTGPIQSKISPNKKEQKQPTAIINPQTIEFIKKLGIDDPLELILNSSNIINDTNQTVEYNSTKSFIDDTEIFDDDDVLVEDLSPVKLGKICLPEPKGQESEYSSEEELSNEDINKCDGEEDIKVVEEKITIIETPVNKKFKRRNQDLYSSED